MKLFLPIVLFLFASAQVDTIAAAIPADSIGMEKKNGMSFILHKVEAKETLYSLSRRYNIPIYQIIEHNPPSEFGLDVGQIIKVPYIEKERTVKQQPKEGEKIHVIQPKETIYSLSRKYDVSIRDIKKWNNMESNLLEVGQKLIVGKASAKADPPPQKTEGVKTHTVQAGETLYSLSRKFNINIDELKEWNKISSNEINVGQEIIVAKASARPVLAGVSVEDEPETFVNNSPAEEETTDEQEKGTAVVKPDKTQVVTTSGEGSTFEEVTESGIAELIAGSGNTRKYLALHRTAAIGTILRVRNDMNDQEVFVRVLGKLPDTGLNKNVLIKISKPAYERLGAIDARFRVSISYIP